VTIVEPGCIPHRLRRAFTDPARSRHRRLRRHRRQATKGTRHRPRHSAGDPAKAATAITAAVKHATPPGFLLLASDALAVYRGVAKARIADVTEWEALSTDYTA
jgi:hypothetical protein